MQTILAGLVLGIIITIAILMILVPSYYAGKYGCFKKASSFEKVEFALFSGCMVLNDGKMVPFDQIVFVKK